MGKKSAPSPPPPPDPVATANAQAAANKEAAIASAELGMVDQYTPYGSLVYRPAGSTGFDYSPYQGQSSQGYVAPAQQPAPAQAPQQTPSMYTAGRGNSTGQARSTYNTPYGDVNVPSVDPYSYATGPSATGNNWSGSSSFNNDTWQPTPPPASAFTASGTPRYEAVQTLSPDQQAILDRQEQLDIDLLGVAGDQLGRVSNALGQPLSFAGMPAQVAQIQNATTVDGVNGVQGRIPARDFNQALQPYALRGQVGADDFGDDRLRVEQALMERMQPYLNQDRDRLETMMANQGLQAGSEAYARQVDEANRQANDARLAAILSAGDEQARLFGMDVTQGQFANNARAQAFDEQAALFGMDVTRGQFANAARAQTFQEQQVQAALANQARQQAIQEAMLLRQTPINEISAIMSGAQVTPPSFVPVSMPSIGAAPIAESTYASYNGAVNANAAQQQRAAANQQGLFGLLGAGLGAGAYAWGAR